MKVVIELEVEEAKTFYWRGVFSVLNNEFRYIDGDQALQPNQEFRVHGITGYPVGTIKTVGGFNG